MAGNVNASASSHHLAASSSSNMGDNTEPAASKTALSIKIKSWNAVAVWRWQANDDSCGICRQAFDACCSDCNMPGDDCPLVWGECTHCFHLHCIDKWCQTQASRAHCPMCRQEWKEQVKSVVQQLTEKLSGTTPAHSTRYRQAHAN